MLEQAGFHNGTAFREVVREHQRGVYAFALHLTGNHHDAEDLSQDVFIQAHRTLASFRGDGSLRSWLLRITVNTFVSGRRKKSLTMVQPRDLFDHEVASDQAGPEQDAQATAIRLEVERALEDLSPQERAAFALRFHSDLPVREVAEAMGVADGTVKSLLFRAVQKLRRQLGHLVADLT
ncbi:MAG: RNA polymerase sigma factor [Rhodothermales bacterium]